MGTPEKEVVEMELEEREEKKDESTEKDKKEKKVKEKKVKVPKVKREPGPSCIDTLSSGLDLGARDTRGINVEIDLDFDDVIAEPKAAHGFDPVWRLSFILFSQTKLWTYRILAALLAAPLSILWGLLSASSPSCTSGSSAPSCGSSRPCSPSSAGSGLFYSTPPLRPSVTLSGESSRRLPGLFNPPEQIVFGLLILSRQSGAENEIQRRSHVKTLRLMCECSPPLNVDHSGNSTNAEIANVSQDQTLK